MFCKKGVLKNFTKFTGKHLCQSLFFNEVAGLRPTSSPERCAGDEVGPEACNFIKKRLWHRCFPVNFVKYLRTPISIEHL